jgi:hypothetical protein
MNLTETTLLHRLDKMNPVAKEVKLGHLLEDVLVNYNALQVTCAALQAKYELLLAHLDTANVAGIGAANVATYGVAATTAVPIALLSGR